MYGHSSSAFPIKADDHANQSAKRDSSCQADNQPGPKRRRALAAQLTPLNDPEIDAIHDSTQVANPNMLASYQRNDYIEKALPREREDLLTPRPNALASGHGCPDPSDSWTDFPPIAFLAEANSVPSGQPLIRDEHSIDPSSFFGRSAEADRSQPLDSGPPPFMVPRKSKGGRVNDLDHRNVEELTDSEGIPNTPSGKSYHCFRRKL